MACHQPACRLSACAHGHHDVRGGHLHGRDDGDHDGGVRGDAPSHGDDGGGNSEAVRNRWVVRNTPAPGVGNKPAAD